MAREATYQLRLDEATKRASFQVFRDLGMTPAEGMRIFLTMVAKTKSIPFPINVPNLETQKVLAETDAGIDIHKAKDAKGLFKQLGI